MKKLLVLLFSLLISFNSYGDVRHCSNEVTKSLGLERCYSAHNHDYTSYYENGNKAYEIVYVENQMTKTMFYESGQKFWEENSKDDKLDGMTYYWDENGLITSESNWKDGECVSGDCPE